jgi:hypothetical protein
MEMLVNYAFDVLPPKGVHASGGSFFGQRKAQA